MQPHACLIWRRSEAPMARCESTVPRATSANMACTSSPASPAARSVERQFLLSFWTVRPIRFVLGMPLNRRCASPKRRKAFTGFGNGAEASRRTEDGVVRANSLRKPHGVPAPLGPGMGWFVRTPRRSPPYESIWYEHQAPVDREPDGTWVVQSNTFLSRILSSSETLLV